MSEQKGLVPDVSSSLQVWSQLGIDRRTQIVELMTQLALNLLLIQIADRSKEEQDVKPISRAQSTS